MNRREFLNVLGASPFAPIFLSKIKVMESKKMKRAYPAEYLNTLAILTGYVFNGKSKTGGIAFSATEEDVKKAMAIADKALCDFIDEGSLY